MIIWKPRSDHINSCLYIFKYCDTFELKSPRISAEVLILYIKLSDDNPARQNKAWVSSQCGHKHMPVYVLRSMTGQQRQDQLAVDIPKVFILGPIILLEIY